MHLIRTTIAQGIDKHKPPHVSVKIIGTHCDFGSDKQRAINLAACATFVESESWGDGDQEVYELLNTLRHYGMATSMPTCGPGGEQADPDILWQKIYSGSDGDGTSWVVGYSAVLS